MVEFDTEIRVSDYSLCLVIFVRGFGSICFNIFVHNLDCNSLSLPLLKIFIEDVKLCYAI